jgi:DNA-binding transcriptional regulator YiaG
MATKQKVYGTLPIGKADPEVKAARERAERVAAMQAEQDEKDRLWREAMHQRALARTAATIALGPVLRELREASGLTQGEMSEFLGIAASELSRAEHGRSDLDDRRVLDGYRAAAKLAGVLSERKAKASA